MVRFLSSLWFFYTLQTEKLTIGGVLRLYKLFRTHRSLDGFYFSSTGLMRMNMENTINVIWHMQRLCEKTGTCD
jgi:hypothetical protein